MARRRFFVEEVRNGLADLTGEEAHHLTRVLRVEPGQRYEVSDNRNVFLAEVETARKDWVVFRILEPIAGIEPNVRLALFLSLVKFDRFESALEKATELGVHTITPVETDRSEKGLAEGAQKRMSRWHKIVLEASQQSRRLRLPTIHEPVALGDALHFTSTHHFVLDENRGAPGAFAALPEIRQAEDTVALLVGPEGGWTDHERAQALALKWRPMSLGPNILRTETAAAAALALLVAAWDTSQLATPRPKPSSGA